MRMGKVRPGWMQWRIKGALCMKTNLSEKRITTGKLTELALHASEQRVRGRLLFNVYYVVTQALAMAALVAIIMMEIWKI